MNASARNVAGLVLAVIAAYVTVGVVTTIDLALGLSPTRADTAAGYYLLHLTSAWQYFVGAAVLGGLAAIGVRDPRGRMWPFVAGLLAAGMKAVGYRYIAPEWQEWAIAGVELLLTGGIAAGAFLLVARLRSRGAQPPDLEAQGSEAAA